MFWMCIRIALDDAILKHIHNIQFYGDIMKIIHFYHFDSDPRFPPFLLYFRWKSWEMFLDVKKTGFLESANVVCSSDHVRPDSDPNCLPQ